MVKASYELEDEKISCVIQFSELNCRVIFLKGERLWLVSPIITEGVRSRKFLNTVFSKILFQLDTGEVPNLDRLIICNNSLGEEGISFFKERFPDVEVSEFEFSEEIFDPQDNTIESISAFTTAIGAAWAASGYKKETFANISFLPKYVKDRQKIFKLQWHGMLLLILIMVSFPGINALWQQSFSQINLLENEIAIVDTQLQLYEPTVNNFNRVSSLLSQIQDQLVLMNTLSENSITWSVNLDLINSGVDEIGGVWLQAITPGDNPNTLNIQGIARDRERVSAVAELFADATLLDVTRSVIRDVEVYNFSYYVNKIVDDTNVYTPQSLQGLGDLTGE
jgi:Tfp pilus assembly protein PilN